jgi:hypothetical protein
MPIMRMLWVGSSLPTSTDAVAHDVKRLADDRHGEVAQPTQREADGDGAVGVEDDVRHLAVHAKMRSIGSICGIRYGVGVALGAHGSAPMLSAKVLPVGLTAFTASRTQPLLEVGGLEL